MSPIISNHNSARQFEAEPKHTNPIISKVVDLLPAHFTPDERESLKNKHKNLNIIIGEAPVVPGAEQTEVIIPDNVKEEDIELYILGIENLTEVITESISLEILQKYYDLERHKDKLDPGLPNILKMSVEGNDEILFSFGDLIIPLQRFYITGDRREVDEIIKQRSMGMVTFESSIAELGRYLSTFQSYIDQTQNPDSKMSKIVLGSYDQGLPDNVYIGKSNMKRIALSAALLTTATAATVGFSSLAIDAGFPFLLWKLSTVPAIGALLSSLTLINSALSFSDSVEVSLHVLVHEIVHKLSKGENRDGFYNLKK